MGLIANASSIVAACLALAACADAGNAPANPGPELDGGSGTPAVDAGEPICPESCLFPVADHVDLTYEVWGEPGVHFYVADPSWAMAATHGARLLAYYLGGSLEDTVSPNWFLATALKESFLGCCESQPPDARHPHAVWAAQPASYGDGCFQIEPTTAFVELQRIFPAHYRDASHAELIGGCRVASSALSMAFYDAFAFGMMHAYLDSPSRFFDEAVDPGAVELTFSLAYNRGAWSSELQQALGRCATAGDLLACVFGDSQTVARDHAYAIRRYVVDLDTAALSGQCYDAAISSSDVADYVDAIAPLLAPGRRDALRDEAVAAFEAAAGGSTGSFQSTFGAVLEVLEREPLQNPFPQLAEWYGVSGPLDGGAFDWPPIESSCDSVGPIL